MPAPGAPTLFLLALIPLIVWRMYSRVRRLVGRQRLSRVRPWITLTLFPLLVLALGYLAFPNLEVLGWLGGAIACGALLGAYGLKKTRFEPTREGLFYTPNAHLGIALSLLFAGRIAWRVIEVYVLEPGRTRSPLEFAHSPLTLSIFGLLAGYYIAYAIGLLRWRFAVKKRSSTKGGSS
jgi:hypothetical protein